jgi:peptide subunit release factor 1 (eRF1)
MKKLLSARNDNSHGQKDQNGRMRWTRAISSLAHFEQDEQNAGDLQRCHPLSGMFKSLIKVYLFDPFGRGETYTTT